MITQVTGYGALHHVELDVEVSAKGITVKAGSFKVCGEDFELDDDVEVALDINNDARRTVLGLLVQDVATEEVTVLYDEYETQEEPYDFQDGAYRRLDRIVKAAVPAGDFDLTSDTVRVKTYRILPAEQRPKPPMPPDPVEIPEEPPPKEPKPMKVDKE